MAEEGKKHNEETEDYLRARRVRSQHRWFMREVVDPLKKENYGKESK